MRNPHGVEPTQFMKRKKSSSAIHCFHCYGPVFCDNYGYDIYIINNCNRADSCFIGNDGINSYECHPKYKKSLFVNTAGPDGNNSFSVLDYEVYTHN